MKRINPRRIDDERHLDDLANNTRLNETTYPELSSEKHLLVQAYRNYNAQSGNAWNIQAPNLSQKLEIGLLSHYRSPPDSINYLDSITNSSPDVCPMCGAFKPFSRDHILPKADYQAWAIFSKNLVPACDCNLKRGSALKGSPVTGARILHPYYDDVLRDRLLSCEVRRNGSIFSLKVTYVDLQHAEIASIKYHTKNVVLKSGIEGWLRKQLSKVKERPSNVIQTLPRRRVLSVDQVREYIEDCLDRNDDLTGTPNNWLSILCHGVLNSAGIVEWITDRHNMTLVP